ncbi:hypothetical protein NKJ46_27390 [Mesorhizobium sp. M0166]
MAPSYAIPRLLARHGLGFEDVDSPGDPRSLRGPGAGECRCDANFGTFPWDRVNPDDGSVAIGHPFGATGARDLSQAVKELWSRPVGSRAVISVCADGGQGAVALLEPV